MKIKNSLYQSSRKGLIAAALTLFVYKFFYIEFFRASVEDAAFDAINWFSLSKSKVDMQIPNVMLLLVDDYYLQSKNLLDENNETSYGYLFPREYIAEIIENVDETVESLDEENYPKGLFVDYDFSYLSDPLNITPTKGDLRLLDVLKKERPYTIYLPMTSNQNYIFYSTDVQIQSLIKNEKIKFVSVGLTSASDNISRRYYPYTLYSNQESQPMLFEHIAIALWKSHVSPNMDVNTTFNQTQLSLIENRIILKDNHETQEKKYTSWQSNWKQLSGFSANYPLDMIYEESFKNAVLMVGATHQLSSDNFEIDTFSNKKSGVEMHADALMTLYYLNGKLKRLPAIQSAIVTFIVITFLDYFLRLIRRFYSNVIKKLKNKEVTFKQKIMHWIFTENEEDYLDRWLLWIAMIVLAFISYRLLIDFKLWFNWMVPSLMSGYYLFITIAGKLFFRKTN